MIKVIADDSIPRDQAPFVSGPIVLTHKGLVHKFKGHREFWWHLISCLASGEMTEEEVKDIMSFGARSLAKSGHAVVIENLASPERRPKG